MYAQLSDYAVYYTYNTSDVEMIEALLQTATSKINVLAEKYHFDIEEAVLNEDYLNIVKSVCVNATHRAIDNITDTQTPSIVSGVTQSALGYSLTTNYTNKSQNLYITRAELKELGFLRQRISSIDMASLISEVT